MSLPTARTGAALLLAASANALDHAAYRKAFELAVAEGSTSGPPGGGYSDDYTKLNLARTRRLEKTLRVLPEVRELMAAVRPQTWLVITAPWCGDSAQNLPVLVALAALAPAITVRIAERDEHPELMDAYLTNGARSIPKLIAFDPTTGEEFFTWGPRPRTAQELVMANRTLPEAERLSKGELAEKLHRWYGENAGQETQLELAALVKERG